MAKLLIDYVLLSIYATIDWLAISAIVCLLQKLPVSPSYSINEFKLATHGKMQLLRLQHKKS